ncbi:MULTISPECIES: hypothetical protein [unclassified Treponema]|jgi:hypothetical protein|uniref:hypothetical protein n=1 Tax=unclassified Treponema TaxID=2638727 RepID=UPI0025D01B0D|nr:MULTISPECIES: hypothetical protein [unclassified Treponema]MBQ8681019.1 hypothetical protein [Treponema sp.]
MIKKVLLSAVFLLSAIIPAFSQSSEELTVILQSEKATLAQISYLPALYANLIDEKGSEAQAFEALKNTGYFSEDSSSDSEASLQDACGILVKTLGIKGGLFYSLFKSNRYAFKELKARGILPNTADPDYKLSGRDFLDLFNSCLTLAGGAQ